LIVELQWLMGACLAQGALSSSLQKIINHQSSIGNHQSFD